MPITRSQIEAELKQLPPEQHEAFLAEVEKRLAAERGTSPTAEPTSGLETVRSLVRTGMQTEVPQVLRPLLSGLGPPGRALAFMGSPEGALELAPTVGAVVSGLAAAPTGPGAVAAATGGAMGGEAFRQLVRRAVGLPQATGIVQKLADLDPDSTGAAVAGIVAEGAVSPAASLVTKAASSVARFLEKSALRSVLNILQPRTQKEKTKAMELAKRALEEGLVPFGRHRETQLARAEKALEIAKSNLTAEENSLVSAGGQVPTAEVLSRVREAIPALLPTGRTPEAGLAVRKAAQRVARDVANSVSGQAEVPLDLAMAEKRRWDQILKSFYKTGRENVPETAQFSKGAADAWRTEIHKAFPTLQVKNAEVSDLVTITKMMERALAESERIGGLGTAATEAAFAGSLAAGRHSIPAMIAAKIGISSGPFASMSAQGKKLFANLIKSGGDSAQTWLRIADTFNAPRTEAPEEEEEQDVTSLIRNLINSQSGPSEEDEPSEEDFISRYRER